jgi:hypothetical protein
MRLENPDARWTYELQEGRCSASFCGVVDILAEGIAAVDWPTSQSREKCICTNDAWGRWRYAEVGYKLVAGGSLCQIVGQRKGGGVDEGSCFVACRESLVVDGPMRLVNLASDVPVGSLLWLVTVRRDWPWVLD